MADFDIKEKKPTAPPVIDEKDDSLERYQGQWGIVFVHKDTRHLVDLDEHHDTETLAQARINEAISVLNIGVSFLCVRTSAGFVAITKNDLAYAYPIPLSKDSE